MIIEVVIVIGRTEMKPSRFISFRMTLAPLPKMQLNLHPWVLVKDPLQLVNKNNSYIIYLQIY